MTTPPTTLTHHTAAWRIPADAGEEYGVLVKCGPPGHPYWWLLCPATATLYIGDSDTLDCQIGGECDWLDVHLKADRVRRTVLGAAS